MIKFIKRILAIMAVLCWMPSMNVYASEKEVIKNNEKIFSGVYGIESSEDINKIMTANNSQSRVEIINFKSSDNQGWELNYDNDMKGYTIKLNNSDSKYLTADFGLSLEKFYVGSGFPKIMSIYWKFELVNGTSDHYIIRNVAYPELVLTYDSSFNKMEVQRYVGNYQHFIIRKDKNKFNSNLELPTRIASKLDLNKVIDISTNNNAILNTKKDASKQHWTFEYDSSKGAYKIRNTTDTNKVLTAVPGPAWDNNAVASEDSFNPLQYWYLKQSVEGYFILANYAERPVVLVVADGDNADGTNVKVEYYSKVNINNVQFKLGR